MGNTAAPNRAFFTVCNYNAERNGSLSASMECLCALKTDRTTVLVWDNASSDGSQSILEKSRDDGTVDTLVLSGRNMGKAYAMNVLATMARTMYGAAPTDVLVSMDSDMCVRNPNFAQELLDVFGGERRLGFVGFEYYEDDGMERKSPYHKLAEGVHVDHRIAVPLNGITYAPLRNFGGYLGGGLLAMRMAMFSNVGGYSTDLANGGRLALYGGDDSMLECKLWNMFGSRFMFLFDGRPQIVHRPDKDTGYAEWKKKCLASFVKDGYGRCAIPERGYYD